MSEGLGSPCPQCGQALHRWPTVDDTGYLMSCGACGYEHFVNTTIPDEPKPVPPLASDSKLRHLLDKRRGTSVDEWPASLLEQLPDEIKAVLTVRCPNCQTIVTRQTETCPRCGQPLEVERDAG
jgi:DNA-directed RNA polymerase subunit M/transcription elongation factor TFIIS